MPIRPPEYDRAVEALTPTLDGLPGKLIAIDGRDGSGKTTLGRFLAWYFNVSLIETDLFLIEGNGLSYRLEEIDRIIAARISRRRPVIVDGIAILRLLSQINREPDFLIYLSNKEYEGSYTLSQDLLRYEDLYKPKDKANLILEISH